MESSAEKTKELILCHKLWFYNPYIFETECRKPMIFQTFIIWSNRTHSLKYQRSTTLESKDIGIRKIRVCCKDSTKEKDEEGRKLEYTSTRQTRIDKLRLWIQAYFPAKRTLSEFKNATILGLYHAELRKSVFTFYV